jgi:hypothetical protein
MELLLENQSLDNDILEGRTQKHYWRWSMHGRSRNRSTFLVFHHLLENQNINNNNFGMSNIEALLEMELLLENKSNANDNLRRLNIEALLEMEQVCAKQETKHIISFPPVVGKPKYW